MADKNTSMRDTLNTRYTITSADVTTLLTRYLVENPNAKPERLKVFKEISGAQ